MAEASTQIAPLEGVIQSYDWGSHRFLAELRGETPPSARPEAELWLGAHPRGAARVATGAGAVEPLDAWIARDPLAALGPDVAARFDARLPFLLKILAVERALSLQAHPDAAQARAGFEREARAGVAAAARLYSDASAKPELIVAWTPFRALCGVRAPDAVRALFTRAGLGDLAPAPGADGERWLRDFLARWLGPDADSARTRRIEAALAATRDAVQDAPFVWLHRLATQHPGDPGIVAPLFLHLVELAPGEGLFLEAGELHCYLEGAAIEIMASSDNVLRAGLTTKPRAVDELLRIGRFAPRTPAILRGVPRAPGERVYATPAREFELAVLEVGPDGCEVAAPHGVEILLGAAGAVEVRSATGAPVLTLRPGDACFVPAAAGAYRLAGAGRLHRARVAPAPGGPEPVR
jgi:mannose-6-phosphate isomerase